MITKFADRISSMPDSIFAVMSKMANEYNAVNLGQGFPDFDGPEWLYHEAFKAMQEGKNQYAPTQGIFTLRRNIAEIQAKHYGMDYDPESEITITTGATEALYCAFNAIINPGDEVIVFEPFYDSYPADIELAGGIPVCVTLYKPNFAFDFNELRNSVNNKTKAIVLNTPHNPTGKVFTIEELKFIAQIAQENNLIVIADEAYEFLSYSGIQHLSIATLPGMRNRTVKISSTGKTFGVTGWKIGYVSANAGITAAIRKVHQWTTFAVNTPGQHAMAHGFSILDEYLPDFRKLYESKRDLIYNLLLETKFKPHEANGSYFIMVDLPEGSFKNDVDAATKLTQEYGIATIPTSVFYRRSDEGKTMLRLCFAKSDDTIREGIARLGKI